LRLNPYSELLLLTASVFQLEDFNSEGAVESCRRLLEINPNNAKAWYNQGMGLLNLGRFEEAVLSFQASLNNGGTPNNYFYLGYVYQKQQQWAEALKFYQKRLNFPESSSDPFIDAARNRINDVQAFQRQEVDSLK